MHEESKLSVECEQSDGQVRLILAGVLDHVTTGRVWTQVQELQAGDNSLVVEVSGLEYCDGAGQALLYSLLGQAASDGESVRVDGMSDEIKLLLEPFDPEEFRQIIEQESTHFFEDFGRVAVRIWGDFRSQVAFVGELSVAFLRSARHPASVRWKDAWFAFEQAGANATPIIALVAFLFGLIMAFQSAIPMKQFGVEIYVADLIGLGMLRELGVFITAIILAGRTGSAFAAELGTMKINEEVDALTTMGLDPMRFLVVPRVMAAVAVMPLLTMVANLMGLLGGAFVIVSMGYPIRVYWQHVFEIVTMVDLFNGLTKSFFFGLLVGGIGCLRGLQTGTGASAVGQSTTRAVVSGIIWIVIADMVFAVMAFYLGV